MNRHHNISTAIYEAPSVACFVVFVERGYASTSQRGDIENLGETKEEGEW